MRFFKAFEIQQKPLIQWDCFANSQKEYDDLNLSKDPLIVSEKDIPEFEFGVCPWKIASGQLVGRTPAEMAVFETEYDAKNKINGQKRLIDDVNNSSFEFDGKSFPMNESARIYYSVARDLNADCEVMAVDATLYLLSASKITAFYLALNTQLKALLSPNV